MQAKQLRVHRASPCLIISPSSPLQLSLPVVNIWGLGWGEVPSAIPPPHFLPISLPVLHCLPEVQRLRRWDTLRFNNSRTRVSQFRRPFRLLVSDWIRSLRFMDSFVFRPVSRYHTEGVTSWMVSNIPSDTKQSAQCCVITVAQWASRWTSFQLNSIFVSRSSVRRKQKCSRISYN